MFQRYRQKQALLGSGPGPIVRQLLTREDGDPVHLLWSFGVRPHGSWAVLQWWAWGCHLAQVQKPYKAWRLVIGELPSVMYLFPFDFLSFFLLNKAARAVCASALSLGEELLKPSPRLCMLGPRLPFPPGRSVC